MSLDANTFRWELGEAHKRYKENLNAFVAQFPGVKEGDVLESQTRGWLLDDVVRLLGWEAGIVPEAPVEAPKGSTKKRWFLDYFGYELGPGGETVPLMVIEAKRLSEAEPRPITSEAPHNGWSPRDLVIQHLLGQDCLSKTWVAFVEKAQGYLKRVFNDHGAYPRRYVITNGEWFVVFERPAKALIELKPESSDVVVYLTWDAFVDDARQVLRCLHRRSLLSEESVSMASEGEIGAVLARQGGARVLMLALEVVYRSHDDEVGGGPKPNLLVWPSVIIKTSVGRWYVVVDQQIEEGGFQVPMRASYLDAHIADVASASNNFLIRLQSSTAVALPTPRSTREHARDADDLASVPLMQPVTRPGAGAARYRLVVGDLPHFLKRANRGFGACSYHDVTRCPADRRAPAPFVRSVGDRAFFRSGEEHGCFHLTAREARGSAEGEDSHAARCHLWALETGLCCKACGFHEVCFSSATFANAMPCPADAPPQVEAPTPPPGEELEP